MAKSLPRKVKVGFSFALGSQPFVKTYLLYYIFDKRRRFSKTIQLTAPQFELDPVDSTVRYEMIKLCTGSV